MSNILKVEVKQNYLWDSADRIDIWPICLARADPNEYYTKNQLKTEIFGMIPGDSGAKYSRSRDVTDFEKSGDDKVQLGLCLFEREDGKYTISDEARAIAKAYENGEEQEWKNLLCKQILLYDVRVRTIMLFLGKLRNELVTNAPSAYSASPSWRTILKGNEGRCYLFEKTIEGHFVDLIDSFLLLSKHRSLLHLDPLELDRMAEAIYDTIAQTEYLFVSPDPRAGEDSMLLTESLSDILYDIKAILYYLSDMLTREIEKDEVDSVRMSLVPYFFTRNRFSEKISHFSEGEHTVGEELKKIENDLQDIQKNFGRPGYTDQYDNEISLNDSLLRLKETKLKETPHSVFNALMRLYKDRIVGDDIVARIRSLGVDTDRQFVLVGTNGSEEPAYKRNLFSIPHAIELFHKTGIIVYEDDGWMIDYDKVAFLPSSIIDEIVSPEDMKILAGDDYLLHVLKQEFTATRQANGFATASDLEKAFCDALGIKEGRSKFLCEKILSFEQEGRIDVNYMPGLPQLHGRGLCGDKNKRRLKIEFSEEVL